MKNRNVLFGIAAFVIIAIVVIGVLIFFMRGKGSSETAMEQTPEQSTVDLLPADALDVKIEAGANNQYTLRVAKIPSDVATISYEITYDTTSKGTQGIVGSPVPLKAGESTYSNDKIIFGTCSRGKCVYDEGVSNIHIFIRLTYKDGSEKGWESSLEL